MKPAGVQPITSTSHAFSAQERANVSQRFQSLFGREPTDAELDAIRAKGGYQDVLGYGADAADVPGDAWAKYDQIMRAAMGNIGHDDVKKPIGTLTPVDPKNPNQPTSVTFLPPPRGQLPTGPGRAPMANPNVPGATITPYGPEDGDLRGAMVTPGSSVRGTAAGTRTDAAATGVSGFSVPTAVGNYADTFASRLAPRQVTAPAADTDASFNALNTDVSAGATINPEDSADLAQFKGLRGNAASTLATGPSRAEIAQQRLDAFDTEAQPGIQDQIQAVGRDAAKFGRIGMGDTAVRALRPFTDYLTQRQALATRLAADTAEGEIGDRRDNLSQFSGLVDQEEAIGSGRRSELRGERGFKAAIETDNIGRRIGERDTELGVDERNLSRRTGERDTLLGVDERNAVREGDAERAALEMAAGVTGLEGNTRLSQFNAARGLEADITGRETGYRDELRGERGFQEGMSQQDIENEMRRRGIESSEYSQEYDRAIRELALSMGVDPTAAYLGASNNAANQANNGWAGANSALQWYLMNQGRQ